MSDSDSDDDLRPHLLGRREIGHHFFSDSDDDDEIRDYDSCDGFSVPSLGERPPNDVDNTSDDDSAAPTGHFCGDSTPNQGTDSATEVAPALPLRERQEIGGATARKGRNEEADHLFATGEICFLSFDIEHGGEYCGILQLSAEFVRLGIEEAANGSNANDKASYLHRHTECFDMYVNPGDSAIWDEHASAVHGL